MEQENESTHLETTQKAITQKSTMPRLPHWPSSKPGPMVTQPPPGTKRFPLRTEQVIEVDYDQERGVPASDRTEE